MERKKPEDYQLEDFVTDESFINYHFQLNVNDKFFWEKWLKKHPDHSDLVESAKEMLETLSLRLPDNEYKEELEKIEKAIHYEHPVIRNKQEVLVRFLNWNKGRQVIQEKKSRVMKFIIPVVLILFAGAYFLFSYFTMNEPELAEKYNHSSAPIVFTLSDSTIVTLAPESMLRYPGKFNSNERKVYLTGEAQFHVKRDISHPFKVYAGKVTTTVLGTIFNIKEQQGDSIVQVELLTGKLQVEATNGMGLPIQSIILNPDERVVYNSNEQKLHKETWQPDNAQHGLTNSLEFHKDDFLAVAKQLQNVFGITLINLSNKKDWLFTGKFYNSTAKDIVENICIIKKLNYQVQGDTIFIK